MAVFLNRGGNALIRFLYPLVSSFEIESELSINQNLLGNILPREAERLDTVLNLFVHPVETVLTGDSNGVLNGFSGRTSMTNDGYPFNPKKRGSAIF